MRAARPEQLLEGSARLGHSSVLHFSPAASACELPVPGAFSSGLGGGFLSFSFIFSEGSSQISGTLDSAPISVVASANGM